MRCMQQIKEKTLYKCYFIRLFDVVTSHFQENNNNNKIRQWYKEVQVGFEGIRDIQHMQF